MTTGFSAFDTALVHSMGALLCTGCEQAGRLMIWRSRDRFKHGEPTEIYAVKGRVVAR